ncbi:MAG TPA: GTP cyclohydrolase II [Trebonia sp.]|nr:GTP cyclohydrolase II [Trebonia sp.]
MRARILEVTPAIAVANRLGTFQMRAYLIAEGRHVDTHLSVSYGDLSDPVPVRINSACVTSEVFDDGRCDCAWQMWEALARFTMRGQGVLTYHPSHEGRGIGLFRKIQSYAEMERCSLTTVQSFIALGEPPDAREYGAAVAMLRFLGVNRAQLLSNNPGKADALAGAGIKVDSLEDIVGRHNDEWRDYLASKALSFGHLIKAGGESSQGSAMGAWLTGNGREPGNAKP